MTFEVAVVAFAAGYLTARVLERRRWERQRATYLAALATRASQPRTRTGATR